MSKNQIAAQKLFLNADKTKLVGEGDERAAFLYATEGDEIPAEAAELFGLVDGVLPENKPSRKKAETKPAGEAETKA